MNVQHCTLPLSQEKYIEKVLDRFNAVHAKPLGVPLQPHVKLCKDDCPKYDDATNYMKNVPYASPCGSLMYAMVATRPNIAHVVGVVGKFMTNLGRAHCEAIKSILRYLKWTKFRCLCYGKGPLELKGFCDANMANDVDTCKFISGYVYLLAGGAISWCSRLQRVVALSIAEAEYISTIEASKEAILLAHLCSDFGMPEKALVLGCDIR